MIRHRDGPRPLPYKTSTLRKRNPTPKLYDNNHSFLTHEKRKESLKETDNDVQLKYLVLKKKK